MSETGVAPLRRRPPAPIPLALLTGFLGAGKTTLLNRLVQSPALARSVVVINEFGDVALDHLLVEQAQGDMLTLASGCVCCTVRGDLVALLEDLLRRRDNGRMAPFDRIVIETTGLADPGPILNAIAQHPYLVLRYRLDAVVTVVDAVHGGATLDAHHEAVDQVAVADVIVLSKTDLAADVGGLRDRLAALNPAAPLLDACRGEAVPAALFGREAPPTLRPAGPDHHHGEEHGHHAHDHDIGSLVLTADAPVPAASLEIALDLLRRQGGPRLLRAKGLVALDDDPARPLVIQLVQGTLHPPRRLPAWPDADRSTRLVLIGRSLDAVALRRLWDACVGAPAIDRPDAAALADSRTAGGPGLF